MEKSYVSMKDILILLYNKPDGLSFEELSIDNETFLYLSKRQYIVEPNGENFDNGLRLVHEGNIKITSVGREFVENLKEEAKEKQQINKHHKISTRISIITLISTLIGTSIALVNFFISWLSL